MGADNDAGGLTSDEMLKSFGDWIGAAEVEDGETRLKKELKEIEEMTGEQALERVHELRGRFMAMSRNFTERVVRVTAGEKLQWADENLRKTEEILRYWSIMNRKAEVAEQKLVRKFHSDEVWIDLAEGIRHKLGALLNPSEADIFQLGKKKESAIERIDLVESLFKNKDFLAKSELLEYLTCELWLSTEKIPDPSFSLEREIAPLINIGIIETLHEGKFDSIEQSLNQLLAYGNSEIAGTIFNSQELSYDEKEKFSVCYINTFGYLNFVETLSPLTQDPSNKKLFEEFSGQKVVVVMEKLDKVYDEAIDDFKEHYDKKVTEREVNLVAEVLERVIGKKLSEARILEVAAGFGRLAQKILQAGCGHLTAVEPHEKMFGILAANSENHTNFRPIQGTWENLKKYDLGQQDLGVSLDGTNDLGICLGRSLPHANSPERALVAFGQMIGVAKTWLVDEPDPEIGYYADFSSSLEKTLISKGVRPDKAKMIYDSPDGKHYFHRMILGKEQLELVGKMLGFKIRTEKSEIIPGDLEVKNVYYLIEVDEEFDLLELIGSGELKEIVKKLGMDKRGVNFDLVPEGWTMSLGQALVCADNEDNGVELAALVELENQHFGIPKMINTYDKQGGVYLKFRQHILNRPEIANERWTKI